MVPAFTAHRSTREAPTCYPGSIATTTPQTFTVASGPDAICQTRSRPPTNATVVHCKPAPIRQVPSRFIAYGTSSMVPSVRLLVLLAGPAPSGSTGTSRRCQGCSHPPRRPPDQAAPSFTQPLRRPSRAGLSPPLGNTAPRGARSRPRRSPRTPSRAAGTARTASPRGLCR